MRNRSSPADTRSRQDSSSPRQELSGQKETYAGRSNILTHNSSEPAAPGGPATASGGAPAPAPGGRGLNDMIRRMRGGPGVTPQPVEEQPVPDAEVDQPEEAQPVQPVPPPH